MKKKLLCLILCLAMLGVLAPSALAAPALSPGEGESAVLAEASTGRVLWEKDADRVLEPASITKLMTLLLTLEELEAGRLSEEEILTVSPYAASMGGSQVYMEAGERFTLRDVLKCAAVVSANDACVVLAERIAGSENAFAERMNGRSAELGMKNTRFCNCTGLPAEGHVTTARDVAILSCELLKHPHILDFTTVWMDSIRDGAFQLANTNKLLRSYPGANGLKTGSTDAAGCCLAASAERDGMTLVAVVMKAATSADRFSAATKLLDFGFATYTLLQAEPELPVLPVRMGERTALRPVPAGEVRTVTERTRAGGATLRTETEPELHAPVAPGQKVGELIWSAGEEELLRLPLLAAEGVSRIGFRTVLAGVLRRIFLGRAAGNALLP